MNYIVRVLYCVSRNAVNSHRSHLCGSIRKTNRIHFGSKPDKFENRHTVRIVFKKPESFRVLFGVTRMRRRIVAGVVPLLHIFLYISVKIVLVYLIHQRICICEWNAYSFCEEGVVSFLRSCRWLVLACISASCNRSGKSTCGLWIYPELQPPTKIGLLKRIDVLAMLTRVRFEFIILKLLEVLVWRYVAWIVFRLSRKWLPVCCVNSWQIFRISEKQKMVILK